MYYKMPLLVEENLLISKCVTEAVCTFIILVLVPRTYAAP